MGDGFYAGCESKRIYKGHVCGCGEGNKICKMGLPSLLEVQMKCSRGIAETRLNLYEFGGRNC